MFLSCCFLFTSAKLVGFQSTTTDKIYVLIDIIYICLLLIDNEEIIVDV